MTFISVLIPHDCGTDAAALAENILVEGAASNRVRFKVGRDDVSVELHDE